MEPGFTIAHGARALRGQKPPVTPRRAARGKRNIARRRASRKRVFVQRHQVIAVISALGIVDGEQPGTLAGLRLGGQTLLELVVDRVARCAGGMAILCAPDAVEATQKLVGNRAAVAPVAAFDLTAILGAIQPSEAPVVLVHDLAFPFAGAALMTKMLLGALDHGAAIPIGARETSVGELSDNLVLPPVGARGLRPVAMPQAFLRQALQELGAQNQFGDLAAERIWEVLQRQGESVLAVPNPRFNIRIGNSLEWQLARRVIWPWLQKIGKPGGADKSRAREESPPPPGRDQ